MLIYSGRVRFLFSLIANIFRGILNFATNLLIARFLLPAEYGQLAFLLTSFLAVTQFFDQGVTAAFYTFISREKSRLADNIIYFIWLLLQLLAVCVFIILLAPHAWILSIWDGAPRETVVLAFLAIFMQQIVWWSVVQLGEAKRKTIVAQSATMICAVFFLVAIFFAHWIAGSVGFDINRIFIIMIAVYVTASGILFIIFTKDSWRSNFSLNFLAEFNQSLREYWQYCNPLILQSGVTFFYTFLDVWLLTHFAGAIQQAFFQIGQRFTGICLLGATAVMRVFWKELSSLYGQDNQERLKEVFFQTLYVVTFMGAVICGFLVFWSKEIILFSLGANYEPGWLVLAVMFFYPLHQGVGQLVGAAYCATSRTALSARLSVMVMLVSIPVSYFVLAPSHALIPGFGLGALGLALKMVILNILSVNLSLYVFCKINHWKYSGWREIFVITFTCALGFLSKIFCVEFVLLFVKCPLILEMVIGGVFYILIVFTFLLWQPNWFLGVDRKNLFKFVKP